MDGFLFLDKFDHNNFSEAVTSIVKSQIAAYENRFGKKPTSFTGDQLYGNRTNRKLMEDLEIRSSFKPLGRKSEVKKPDRWYKVRQKERNRIEGNFGNRKEHYGLNRIKYQGTEGAAPWVRLGILGMNLTTALART